MERGHGSEEAWCGLRWLSNDGWRRHRTASTLAVRHSGLLPQPAVRQLIPREGAGLKIRTIESNVSDFLSPYFSLDNVLTDFLVIFGKCHSLSYKESEEARPTAKLSDQEAGTLAGFRTLLASLHEGHEFFLIHNQGTTWKVIREIWGAQKVLFFKINKLWKRP